MALFGKLLDLFRTQKQAAKNAVVQGGPAAQWYEFLNEGKWLAVVSSNVDLIRYDYEEEVLYVQFKNGAMYSYRTVSYKEALDFAQAPSKGGWVWDHLRVRGTLLGHRKQYQIEQLGD